LGGPESPLPGAHLVVDQVAGLHPFVQGPILAPADLALHFLVVEFLVGDAGVQGHGEHRQTLDTRVGSFAEQGTQAQGGPMGRHLAQPTDFRVAEFHACGDTPEGRFFNDGFLQVAQQLSFFAEKFTAFFDAVGLEVEPGGNAALFIGWRA